MRVRKDVQLRLAICDDEEADREIIRKSVGEIMQEEAISFEIFSCGSGRELLAAVENQEFHIYLLDVIMVGLDGMELAARLLEKNANAIIIFISSNSQLAMRGYEVSAIRYLAKPIDPEKMREALPFGCGRCLHTREILLPTEKGESRVELASIKYAETWNRGVRLILVSGCVTSHIRISELFELLPKKQFVYCHRQILVNLAFVEHIRYCELELKDGACLPVSKYRVQELKSSFLRYLRI